MAGLVADYGGESEDESCTESSSENKTEEKDDQKYPIKTHDYQEKLPLPDMLKNTPKLTSSPTKLNTASVFFNPFKVKDEEKLEILEKHVKLSEGNNYDSYRDMSKFQRSENTRRFFKQKNSNSKWERNKENDHFKPTTMVKRKRRVGVNDSLIPPKKALEAYKKQRTEEALSHLT